MTTIMTYAAGIPMQMGSVGGSSTEATQVTHTASETFDLPRLAKPADVQGVRAELASAHQKLQSTPDAVHPKHPTVRQTDILSQAAVSANSTNGAEKMDCYKALLKNTAALAIALITTIFAAIATVATAGAGAPILVVSSLILVNAIFETSLAAINFSRVKQGAPLLKAEVVLREGMISLLKKVGVNEQRIAALSNDDFKRFFAAYKFVLTTANTLMTLSFGIPTPTAVKVLSSLLGIIGGSADVVFWHDSSKDSKGTQALTVSQNDLVASAEELVTERICRREFAAELGKPV